ncbi:MAG: choice-of-anchor A family protein [Acetobacteraceae bacterium]|nr:choice-of-anchor A family protein [Acetobacteraceae bacterium]
MAFLAAGLAGALLAAPSGAAPLTANEILSQFNIVVTGDFASTSDVEGRTVVGGNLTHGATFFNNPGAAAASAFRALTVYGDVTAGGPLNVNNGGGAAIGGASAAIINDNGGGGVTTGASLPGFQAHFADPLNALSAQLAGMAADSAPPAAPPGFPNNVMLQASAGTGLAVFALTTAELASYASFAVDLNGREGAVFNVTGASFTATGNFLNALSVARDVIWNFVDAVTLDVRVQWGGTVLAPKAAVSNTTPIEGTLFAASFRGDGEMHSQPFRPGVTPRGSPPTPVPVPASLALLGLGLAGLAAVRRR